MRRACRNQTSRLRAVALVLEAINNDDGIVSAGVASCQAAVVGFPPPSNSIVDKNTVVARIERYTAISTSYDRISAAQLMDTQVPS